VPMIDELTLECSEEAFDARVVPAIALAAHAGDEAVLVKQTLVTMSGVLTTTVRMVEEPRRGGLVRQRHREGLLGQLDRYPLAHFVTVLARIPSTRISRATQCSPMWWPCLTRASQMRGLP